jgi:hypothetical protein
VRRAFVGSLLAVVAVLVMTAAPTEPSPSEPSMAVTAASAIRVPPVLPDALAARPSPAPAASQGLSALVPAASAAPPAGVNEAAAGTASPRCPGGSPEAKVQLSTTLAPSTDHLWYLDFRGEVTNRSGAAVVVGYVTVQLSGTSDQVLDAHNLVPDGNDRLEPGQSVGLSEAGTTYSTGQPRVASVSTSWGWQDARWLDCPTS